MNSKSSVGLFFFLWAEITTVVSDQTIHFFKTHCGKALGTWICSWLQMLNSHGVVSVRCTTTYVLVCYFCVLWNACVLPFPESRLSRTLMVVLQIVCLHSSFSFMGVYALVFFMIRGWPIWFQYKTWRMMDRRVISCHGLLRFRTSFFHFHTVPNIHSLSNNILWQEITGLSSPCAGFDHMVTQFWSRPHKPLNQLNWWSRKLQHETGTFIIAFVLKGFLMWDYTPKTTSSFGKSIKLVLLSHRAVESASMVHVSVSQSSGNGPWSII